MYICRKCGDVFEEPLEDRYDENLGEFLMPRCDAYCPECGSDDFEEAEWCPECSEYVDPDKMYGGMCEKCVYDALDKDSFFRWAVAGATETEYSSFEDFMFTEVFHIHPQECPKASSFEMRMGLKMVYNELSDCCDFKDTMWRYLDSVYEIDNFAEWYLKYTGREVS